MKISSEHGSDMLENTKRFSGATKFGVTSDALRLTVRSDAEYVKQAWEGSLKQLGVDQVDLYYCHRVDI
ncbi:hypothetical protein EJ08DRAFT_704506 [Tothia fuscella]|uniref:NADP-dependent oxidoreductase domain-containing protein n=1 Tax=Tothia fuscella TaxID=1048955 RepID=A0A9P4P452_9PEZI|nr:hypothetical protein EJ08DRAFT_704506 [Tothia fuscella]